MGNMNGEKARLVGDKSRSANRSHKRDKWLAFTKCLPFLNATHIHILPNQVDAIHCEQNKMQSKISVTISKIVVCLQVKKIICVAMKLSPRWAEN